MCLRFILLSLLLLAGAAHATPQGWRWYNTPSSPTQQLKPKPPPMPPQASVTQTPPPKKTLTATEQMQWFQGYMAEVQNKAIINPTVENTLAFMRLSHFIDGKTTDFGMTWKEALLEDPSLSYRMKHPTESLARQTQNAQIKARKVAAVESLANEGYGLFFAYNGNTPLDQQLAPSIQAFADQYGIELLGITLDGKTLATIRDNKRNDGKLNIQTSPALLLVNPKTNSIKPLAYGFISQEELLGRFLNVATDYAPDF
ncbi:MULTISPECIES: type-F conjugative transfer system pilin assembly protein TraF [Photobacterium]|uniref:Type-F conjugative transfer system pilin assembly protein TraF n=2 Tax=Photobacterium TaxID=657 RepID=A0A2T3M488_9GAMM|nr:MULTISPECIES: type-F conjugative transfer system pilin assembly protein TraF [Photobacterium]MCD9476673.1 type-F conjugative transfer system pilin assembly protein TraF [Photobacterium phosphoreum]MCD9524174.1 type-F conjugative transfer system pilin assembly protein TraF [Photobacterium carnosum]MCD9554499.1 type-F conjugative transfer system pilin assembly protein TraF [Photobacterium carnosum]MCF2177342.1 type-F conjugative transfer system pilin assembly protein TraF [Photobacterium phosp